VECATEWHGEVAGLGRAPCGTVWLVFDVFGLVGESNSAARECSCGAPLGMPVASDAWSSPDFGNPEPESQRAQRLVMYAWVVLSR
jgi:hypothetical protein